MASERKGFYNGFSNQYRMKVYQMQKKLRDKGEYIDWRVEKCYICGECKYENMVHLEDYNNIEDYKVVCIPCHMRLHARFRCPSVWLWHLEKISKGESPKQYRTVNDYFNSGTPFKIKGYEGKSPLDFGDNWYNKLPMSPVDICKGVHKYE